jgi:hypothetical protein
MTSPFRAERFMRGLQELERKRDPSTLLPLFADGCELSNLALAEPLRGREGARRFWSDYLANFRSIETRLTHANDDGDHSTLEWISHAKLRGGEQIVYRGITVLEWDGAERVKSFRAYYDSAALHPRVA